RLPKGGIPGMNSSHAWKVVQAQEYEAIVVGAASGATASGALLPPTNTLRSDGIGHSIKMETPELDGNDANPGLHQLVMRRVNTAFPDSIAEAIEEQLEKVTSVKATDALLEDMLSGLTLLVPDRYGLYDAMATIKIKATLFNPRHEGPTVGWKVLERKN